MTFSINISDCRGNGALNIGGGPWPLVDLATAQADITGQYEAIVPTCKVGPGGVGWLDMGCGGSLADQIATPCNDYVRHSHVVAHEHRQPKHPTA